MTKLKLDIDGIEDDFFTGTRLLGIMSMKKDYQFCWQVNGDLGFDFRLNADAEIQLRRKGRYYYFPVYQFSQTDAELEHYIYHNQFEGEYLLPEFKHLDFLWLVRSDRIPEEDFMSLQQNLKTISGIQ